MNLRYVLLLLVLMPAVSAVSIDSIAVSPSGNVTTTATLSCLVTVSGSGSLAANITWYRNSIIHGTDNETIALTNSTEAGTSATGNIEAADTTKADSWRCQATAYNGSAVTASNSSAVVIRNTPPAISNPTTTQLVNEDTPYALTATATDADGDSIVQFISSDLNASLYSNTALFTIAINGDISFTPSQAAIGNHTMAILAYDGEEFGGQNVLYTVVPFDDVPYFNPSLTNQSATVLSAYSYVITAVDEESDALNFTFSASSPNIILNQTTGTTATLSFIGGTPQFSDRGVHQVNITVYQNATPTKNSTQTITLNVTAPNRVPVLDFIANQTSIQGASLTLSFNASDNDTEDLLFFEVSSGCAAEPWSVTTTVNTSNATGLINLTLNNSHVVCRNVTITVRDYEGGIQQGGSDSQAVFFNITNVNDAPIVQNSSLSVANSQGQTDLRTLSAYTSVVFTYVVNATDVDTLTYASDTLTYADNTTLFAIDAMTGVISFTPSGGDVGTHSINISVTDSNGSVAFAVMNLTIVSNDPPAITSVSQIICQEDTVCLYNFTATDDDQSENLTFTSNSSLVNFTQLSYNISLFNRTYTNSDVGNYSIMVTVTDIAGYTNTTNFTLVINNTNDAPIFDGNQDNITDAQAMPVPVVVGVQTTWLINASDLDSRNIAENLTYTAIITSGPNAALFTIQELSESQARIRFTPAEADIGNYTLNITVADLASTNDSRLVTFIVYNRSLEPLITAVQPYYNGSVQINTSLTATSNTSTVLTFAENTTVTYNISFDDVDSALSNITVRYYRDGVLVQNASSTAPNFTVVYDFFSAGSHVYMVIVQDEYFSSDNFSWNVTVSNVNRAPIFTPSMQNRTVNSTTLYSNELDDFIDPDDDTDSDGTIDGGESNTLNFTMSSSDYLSASFTAFDVTLTPSASGSSEVYYTATDSGGLQAISNNVTYTVFYNPDEESSSSSSSSSGGGGGGSSVVPQRVPTPEPYSLELIAPKPITIYVNQTVVAPLTIKNDGKNALSGITLTARSDADLTFSFSEYQIVRLAEDESRDITLTIEGFRDAGTIEVFVSADVQVPAFNDTAIIYINSIEQKKEGEDAVNLKITYARDMLTDTPACGELVQLVDQAEQAYKGGDVQTAEDLLTAVTEGCTFLKKQVAEEIEVPGVLHALAGYRYVNVILGGLLVVLLVTGALLLMHYGRQQ